MIAGCLVWVGSAFADVAQMKLYKAAYPDENPRCRNCHAMVVPNKDSHALNAYGKAAKAAYKQLTADSYRKVGKAERFKAAPDREK